MKDFGGGLVERSWQGQNLRAEMEATEIEPPYMPNPTSILIHS